MKAPQFYWACTCKNCRGTVDTEVFVVEGTEGMVLSVNHGHNHPPETGTIQKAEFVQQMLRKVVEDPTKTSRKIFNEVLNGANDIAGFPSFHSVRSRINRKRRSLMPPMPATIHDVEIEGIWNKTYNGEKFLQLLDSNWGLAVFATKQSLQNLADCDTLLIDGTFWTAPHPYAQLVSIQDMYIDRIVPFVFSSWQRSRSRSCIISFDQE